MRHIEDVLLRCKAVLLGTTLAAAVTFATVETAAAQATEQAYRPAVVNTSPVPRPGLPGGMIVSSNAAPVCPKCGKVHGRSRAVPATGGVFQTSYQVAGSAINAARGGVQNVLGMLNNQRSRQGLRTLRYDPSLQAVAQRRAQQMASAGLKTHPPGSFAPGRYEGVGWSSSFSPSGVSACYTSDPNMTVAGAAMVRGRDGVYFAVVYR